MYLHIVSVAMHSCFSDKVTNIYLMVWDLSLLLAFRVYRKRPVVWNWLVRKIIIPLPVPAHHLLQLLTAYFKVITSITSKQILDLTQQSKSKNQSETYTAERIIFFEDISHSKLTYFNSNWKYDHNYVSKRNHTTSIYYLRWLTFPGMQLVSIRQNCQHN